VLSPAGVQLLQLHLDGRPSCGSSVRLADVVFGLLGGGMVPPAGTSSMLRSRRRDATLKPNRTLDRSASRGMLYENEELRLRTININAEVEKGTCTSPAASPSRYYYYVSSQTHRSIPPTIVLWQ